MPAPAISLHRFNWSRTLNVQQLNLLNQLHPDLPQAPMATELRLSAQAGEPIRATWSCFVDERLIAALDGLDGEPKPKETATELDLAGSDAGRFASPVPPTRSTAQRVADGVTDAIGLKCEQSTDFDGVTSFFVTKNVDGGKRTAEVWLTNNHFENFDDQLLIATVCTIADAKLGYTPRINKEAKP